MISINNNNKKWKDLPDMDMNNFFKNIKTYCEELKKEEFVHSRRLLDFDKKEIIIFEADIDKIDLSVVDIKKSSKLFMPIDKVFIEIPKWVIETKEYVLQNSGGVFIFNEIMGEREMTTVYSIWMITNKLTGDINIKPINFSAMDYISHSGIKDNEFGHGIKIGTKWKYTVDYIGEVLKKELVVTTKSILYYLLYKIEKKEYSKYKKWTPSGFTNHDIVYSYEVSKHKRHFWKDSGKFNIPFMKEDELKSKGYDIDELVFRDGELRRNVPYRIIGNFLVGEVKENQEDNRRIKLAKGRILRQEEKIYTILRELYLDNIIRRHDRKTLKGIELDFNLPELRLGIEYDGEQHFDKELYEKLYGEGFDEQVKRDRKKDRLCIKKNITLIRIKFDEPLTKTNIKNKIKRILK